jgi:hypothetical protein
MAPHCIGLLRQVTSCCNTLWMPGAAFERSGGQNGPEIPKLDDHAADATADVMMRWFRIQFFWYLSLFICLEAKDNYECLKIGGFSAESRLGNLPVIYVEY